MPRYYFNIRNADGEVLRDSKGWDLADLDAVALAVQELNQQRTRIGSSHSDWYFEISSEDGREKFTAAAFPT